MQTSIGNTLERGSLNLRIRVAGSSLSLCRHEECQRRLIHPTPEERVRFQKAELPRPLRIGIAQPLVLTVGVFLTLFQISAQKRFVSVLKGSLRALATSTGKPAGNDKVNNKRVT